MACHYSGLNSSFWILAAVRLCQYFDMWSFAAYSSLLRVKEKFVVRNSTQYSDRVEQELSLAANTKDHCARHAHFELAVLHAHIVEETVEISIIRDHLRMALFKRIAFAEPTSFELRVMSSRPTHT